MENCNRTVCAAFLQITARWNIPKRMACEEENVMVKNLGM